MHRRQPREELVEALNCYFDSLVPSIEEFGGQVLKFLGDGLLATFPLNGRPAAEVCDRALDAAARTLERIRDEHRVLVGANDRCGTLLQILALIEGCDGPFSFEPFAASVHALDDIAGSLETSMHWIDREIARLPV